MGQDFQNKNYLLFYILFQIYIWTMKPTNPNFGSNFSENMDESVKLQDYMKNQSQVIARQQFMKYASGGRKEYDISEEKDKTQIIIDGIKPIRTEQSQVSGIGGIDNAFAKKGQIINELRNEFDHIKNIRVNTNVRKVEQKLSSSGSQSSRSRPNDDPSSSQMSVSKVNKKDANINIRQQRLWQVQRKQFQYMLNNCQQKIQQLLHNEMQYKKMIHELRSTNFMYKPQPQNDSKWQQQTKELQKQLKQQKQKNYKAASQLQKLKITSKTQSDRLIKLESQNSMRFKDQNKWYEERKRFQENLRLEKDRYLNSQIEKRKFQMENQLYLKEREQEVYRVQKQIQHINALHELSTQSLIKKYQEEIQIKDKRYMLLLSEYEKLKKQYAQEKIIREKEKEKEKEKERQKEREKEKDNTNNNSNNNVMFELLKKLIEDRRKTNPHEELTNTLKDLFDKFKSHDDDYYEYDFGQGRRESSSSNSSKRSHSQATEKLLSEIRMLKAQIESLKNNEDGGVDWDPMKKMYEAEITALKDTIKILQRKLKQATDSPINSKQETGTIIKLRKETERLQRRIRQLQQSTPTKPDKSFSMQEHEQQVSKLKQKIDFIDAQLRKQRRQRSELQFEVSKLRREIQFRTTIMINENQSKLRIKEQELERANSNINQWRQQFENMKNFYELKLREKNQLLEKQLNSVPLEEVRKRYQESLDRAKAQYERQIKAVTQRLSNYNKESIDYDALLKRYSSLQASYFDLQRNIFRAKQTNDGVDHLWQIKETQYGNVYEILRQLDQTKAMGSQFVPSGNTASIQSGIYTNFNSTFGQGTGFVGNQQGSYIVSGQPLTISQPATVISNQTPVIGNSQIFVAQPQVVTTQPLVATTQPQVIYSTVGSQSLNPALVQINQPIVRAPGQYNIVTSGSVAPPTPPGVFGHPAVLSQALNSSSGPFANIQKVNTVGGQTTLQRPESSNSYLDPNIINRQSNAIYT